MKKILKLFSIFFVLLMPLFVLAEDASDINYGDLTDLYQEMKDNAVLDTLIDYSNPSTDLGNGNGIYIFRDTKDDANPVYYYRGDVKNNIAYKGRCWSIIRSTSTGSMKALYRGILNDDGSCKTDALGMSIGTSQFNYQNNQAHNGYMYNLDGIMEGEGINAVDSALKVFTENWYEETFINTSDTYLSSITRNVEDTIYCNDRTIWEEHPEYYTSQARLTPDGARYGQDIQPILTCPRLEDSFTVSSELGNGKLKYPVAHITGDELILSGAVYTQSGKETNAYSLTNKYHAMTPHSASKILYPNSLKFINRNNVNYSTYVRPVMTFKYLFYDTGDGSVENPFHIVDYFPPVKLKINEEIYGNFLDPNKKYSYTIKYYSNFEQKTETFEIGKNDEKEILIDTNTSYELTINDSIDKQFIFIDNANVTSKTITGNILEDDDSLLIVYNRESSVPTGVISNNKIIIIFSLIILVSVILLTKFKIKNEF